MKPMTVVILVISAVMFFGWTISVSFVVSARENRFESIERRLSVLERPCPTTVVLTPEGYKQTVCLR